MSGTKLTTEKKQSVSFRATENSLQYVYGVRMTNYPVKSLRIFLGHDKKAKD